ncbi:MAG TPA: NADP-dependent oxidoreductase [Candidatus Acidoferrum sp.]|nr:NADP-dependent oxidoreductase [Candidatus Acidoferrum sp.]
MAVTTTKSPRAKSSETPDVPRTMRAAAIERFGGPEVLRIHELPVPHLNHDEVLIRLHTSGVGSWDAEMRAGWWPQGEPQFPLVLGTDGAGTVVAKGAHVRRFREGDGVYSYSFANPKGGFYAEYVVVAAEKVAPTPAGLTLDKAGAIPTTGLTAIQGIDDVLKIKREETLIIHGASGGVGTLAIQFAKLREARVLAVASGADGVALARKLGADIAIDGRTGDIAVASHKFAPEGVDAVLGLSGGAPLERSIVALKSGGRVAYPNGVEPAPERRPGIHMTGYDAVAGIREFAHLGIAIESVKLQVPIAVAFSLDDAAKAHERLAKGHVLGKIVLRCQ